MAGNGSSKRLKRMQQQKEERKKDKKDKKDKKEERERKAAKKEKKKEKKKLAKKRKAAESSSSQRSSSSGTCLTTSSSDTEVEVQAAGGPSWNRRKLSRALATATAALQLATAQAGPPGTPGKAAPLPPPPPPKAPAVTAPAAPSAPVLAPTTPAPVPAPKAPAAVTAPAAPTAATAPAATAGWFAPPGTSTVVTVKAAPWRTATSGLVTPKPAAVPYSHWSLPSATEQQLQQQLAAAHAELEANQVQQELTLAEMASVKQRNAELQDEIMHNLMPQIAGLEIQKHDLQGQVDTAGGEVQNLQQQWEQQQVQHQQQQAELEQLQAQLQQQHTAALDQLQTELDCLQAEYDKLWNTRQQGLKWCSLCGRKTYLKKGFCLNSKCMLRNKSLQQSTVTVVSGDGTPYTWKPDSGEHWWSNLPDEAPARGTSAPSSLAPLADAPVADAPEAPEAPGGEIGASAESGGGLGTGSTPDDKETETVPEDKPADGP
jgi:hypothetical protein